MHWGRLALGGLLLGCNVEPEGAVDTLGESGGNETGGDETGTGGPTTLTDSGSGCTEDAECAVGQVCNDGACVPGCLDDSNCGSDKCCGGSCVDVQSDPANCGTCGNACDGTTMCDGGACRLSDCPEGFADCNADGSDGCEYEGECTCGPGLEQGCYTGDPETENVGNCVSGTQTCNEFGTAWLPCDGEVLPESEICANDEDDNCDGTVDEDPDEDGDGFGACSGDCCDVVSAKCSDPALVNPGAFEVDGNKVDDDCDGTEDNPLPACDAGLSSNSNDPFDYARAIDLCSFTEDSPDDPADLVWGVIDASLTLADGTGTPHTSSRSLRDGFGSNITNRFGDRIAVMSTGHAADNFDDANPPYADFQAGQEMGRTSDMPDDWLTANGGSVPTAPGCSSGGTMAEDPVMLTLRVRAPTNANSFSVQMYFLSAEYPEWVCTPYNDFFVTLVDSADNANPPDGNIAIYDDGMTTWPVGINLVDAGNGLFTQCTNGDTGQCIVGPGGGTYNGCTGTSDLDDTGYDIVETVPAMACNYNGLTGGGTGWLTMSGNVVPGETFEIRFAIWDTGDGFYDSLVLLDDWEWDVDASEAGVEPS